GDGVEQGALAHVGQADNAALEAHGNPQKPAGSIWPSLRHATARPRPSGRSLLRGQDQLRRPAFAPSRLKWPRQIQPPDGPFDLVLVDGYLQSLSAAHYAPARKRLTSGHFALDGTETCKVMVIQRGHHIAGLK